MAVETAAMYVGFVVMGLVGFCIGRYVNTPSQGKLVEANRRIDVLTVENEDLTASNQSLLGQKDIWNKTGELVKKQAQTIKDCEAQIDGLNKMLDDQKAKLTLSKSKLDKYEERWLVTSKHWQKQIDKKVRDAKGGH